MYQGATEDGECPLVVDDSTPSCGDSRFGCYVCTMVEQDKSMKAMIQNDDEKDWMRPMLAFRDRYLSFSERGDDDLSRAEVRTRRRGRERENRDFRRLNGAVQIEEASKSKKGTKPLEERELIYGPYVETYRHTLLRELLVTEQKVRRAAPPELSGIELISRPELLRIREIWIEDKSELEDAVPKIYHEVTGQQLEIKPEDQVRAISTEHLELIQEIAEEEFGDPSLYELTRGLIHTAARFRTMVRRKGIYDALEKELVRGAFANAEEAVAFKRDAEREKRERQMRVEAESDPMIERVVRTES